MTKLVFNDEYRKEPMLPGLQTPLEEGEPVFVLRGRDTIAPHLAALWAAVRKGETVEAVAIFSSLMTGPATVFEDSTNYNDTQKSRSALAKSCEMLNWREEKGLVSFPIRHK